MPEPQRLHPGQLSRIPFPRKTVTSLNGAAGPTGRNSRQVPDSVEGSVKRGCQRRYGLQAKEQAQRWRAPVLSLFVVIGNAEGAAVFWYSQGQDLRGGAPRDDAGHRALAPLFSNDIRVAREMGSLIERGYPDGATARWRTLHETTVTARFIRSNPPWMGEPYRPHPPACGRTAMAMTRIRDLAKLSSIPLVPGFLDPYQGLKKERDMLFCQVWPRVQGRLRPGVASDRKIQPSWANSGRPRESRGSGVPMAERLRRVHSHILEGLGMQSRRSWGRAGALSHAT